MPTRRSRALRCAADSHSRQRPTARRPTSARPITRSVGGRRSTSGSISHPRPITIRTATTTASRFRRAPSTFCLTRRRPRFRNPRYSRRTRRGASTPPRIRTCSSCSAHRTAHTSWATSSTRREERLSSPAFSIRALKASRRSSFGEDRSAPARRRFRTRAGRASAPCRSPSRFPRGATGTTFMSCRTTDTTPGRHRCGSRSARVAEVAETRRPRRPR